MKILRPISGTAGVFFPIGKIVNRGTCEFATNKCLENCVALLDFDYDEEYRVSDKKEIYLQFMNRTAYELCPIIFEEMKGLQTNMLQWFASGDCTSQDEGKIIDIMKVLKAETQVIQFGFTRNKYLWEAVRDIIKIVLTCETVDDIPYEEGYIYAVPDYKKNITLLYKMENKERRYVGGCGSVYLEDRFLPKKVESFCDLSPTNCKRCYRLKQGCWS